MKIILLASAALGASVAYSQSLGEALDAPALNWSSGGNAAWAGQTLDSHDNVDAVRSGAISHSQESWLETTVNGPGTLSFYWRVSSEAGWDILRFWVDDAQMTNISGKVSWTQVSLSIAEGFHTLRWSYAKDASGSEGSDAGWLDEVTFEELAVKPEFTSHPESVTVLPGDRVQFWGFANGTPYPTYQWQFFGTNLLHETNSWLEIPSIAPHQAGEYRVIASNKAGSATSEVAIVTVKTAVPLQRVGIWPQEPNGEAYGVFLTNHLAYLANGSNGLVILDVSNPAQCTRLGGADTDGFAYDVQVVGQYAYVADGPHGLQVFSVANPANCVRVGGCNVTNEVSKVAVQGDHAFLMDGWRLHVINVSDPSNCRYVTTTEYGGRGIALSGQYAFVANHGLGLRVVDVSDPTNCVLVQNYMMDYDLADVVLSGTRAYACSEWSGLVAWDVSNPSGCSRLGAARLGGFPRSLALSGSYAFVAAGKLQLVDISIPTNCVRAAVYDTGGSALDVAASGSLAYVAAGTNGLEIVRVGSSGMQLRCPVAFTPGQPLLLRFGNADGSSVTAEQLSGYAVQATDDLKNWSTLSAPLTLTNGSVQLTDPQAASARSRFYRVLRQP